MMKQRFKSKYRKGAFTLIEVMVATVTMVILVGLVIQMASGVLNIWNQSLGKLSANAEARIAMDLLTQDLQTAVIRNDEREWLRLDTNESMEGSRYTNNSVNLKLFSHTPDGGGAGIHGGICAIAYRLAVQKSYDDSEAPDVYGLYRKVVDSNTTFDKLMGNDEQEDLSKGDEWSASEILKEENYLAGNIVEFKIYFRTDTSEADPTSLPTIPESLIIGGENEDAVYPQTNTFLAEIHLTVMTNRGLEILEAHHSKKIVSGGDFLAPGHFDYNNASEIVARHGEVFIRRVHLFSPSL